MVMPCIEFIILSHSHGVGVHAGLVVTNGRDAIFIEKAVAAVHALEQTRGMMAPVKQIDARHVAPVIGFLAGPLVLEYVKQVIPALPEECEVWVGNMTFG